MAGRLTSRLLRPLEPLSFNRVPFPRTVSAKCLRTCAHAHAHALALDHRNHEAADSVALLPAAMTDQNTKVDYQLASLAAGWSLGFGFLTAWEAVKQTRRNKNPRRSAYIYMIWGELLANLILGILAFLFLEGTLQAGVPLFFFILLCWVFEIQLLMQIIINRIAVISESQETVAWIRWGTVAVISSINVAVFTIFIPSHLEHPPPNFVEINKYWDKISKVLICIVDAFLNWYFLRTVRVRLVKYHGLKKYAPLVKFNARLMVVSIMMDLMLIGLMFLPNQTVFIQFHPVTYVTKLMIEMTMANLIKKLASRSYGGEPSTTSKTDGYARGTSRRNEDNPHDHEIQLKSYHQTTARGPSFDAESDGQSLDGIQKTTEVTIQHSANNNPRSPRMGSISMQHRPVDGEGKFVKLADVESV